MPALDEVGAIGAVLEELLAALGELREAGAVGEGRVVVVDNGSTDGTGDLARSLGVEVVREPRRGYGRACLTGLGQLAEGQRPGDLVVFLDADHSDYPEDLGAVLAPLLASEADLVIGSRVLGGATMEALLPQAWFGNRLACLLLALLFGARHTDLGPFRALSAGALAHLAMGDEGFGWTIEMQLKARLARMRVTEVPVRYRARIGTSKITGTWRGTLGAAYKILGWIFGYRLKTWLTPARIPRYPTPTRSAGR
jgi:glycosyltransferase involved in cell wall biosynthesis